MKSLQSGAGATIWRRQPVQPGARPPPRAPFVFGALMARVTVEDCIEKIPNRFELVLMAAQR
ncbi:MAG: DNA-directed RNA polymerase subunit omega, partial [Alphaproteobacteria bacterium]|nr:DNA-directed RNA polymerase subunit omega [Alphaproteobacteria bacterium]